MKNTACFFYSNSEKYSKLLKCAIDSFQKFHPDIPIFPLTKKDPNLYQAIDKFQQALNICSSNNYKKAIFLGADTITCSRLDEFLEYEEDILATLDYPYKLVTKYVETPDDQTHVNADVLCINNLSAMYKICEITIKCPTEYWEQGALNQIIWNRINDYSFRIIDAPYSTSKIIYNARAKGNIIAQPGEKPWHKYTQHWKVRDNKLYSHDNKQIKVFHYCDALGTLDNDKFENMINYWMNTAFNEETKIFFKEYCNCGDFFQGQFKI